MIPWPCDPLRYSVTTAAILGRDFGCGCSAPAELARAAPAAPTAIAAIADRLVQSVISSRCSVVMTSTSMVKRLFERCITFAAVGVQDRVRRLIGGAYQYNIKVPLAV